MIFITDIYLFHKIMIRLTYSKVHTYNYCTVHLHKLELLVSYWWSGDTYNLMRRLCEMIYNYKCVPPWCVWVCVNDWTCVYVRVCVRVWERVCARECVCERECVSEWTCVYPFMHDIPSLMCVSPWSSLNDISKDWKSVRLTKLLN